jgi:hypothetical protein
MFPFSSMLVGLLCLAVAFGAQAATPGTLLKVFNYTNSACTGDPASFQYFELGCTNLLFFSQESSCGGRKIIFGDDCQGQVLADISNGCQKTDTGSTRAECITGEFYKAVTASTSISCGANGSLPSGATLSAAAFFTAIDTCTQYANAGSAKLAAFNGTAGTFNAYSASSECLGSASRLNFTLDKCFINPATSAATIITRAAAHHVTAAFSVLLLAWVAVFMLVA